MNKAPIALFLYNRPQISIKCIESLKANLDFDISDLYIFIDGPKNKEDKKKINELVEYIRHCNFKNLINLDKQEKNRGLANSVYKGVNKIFLEHNRVIVIEDDLVLHPHFLQFMNYCLDSYKAKNIFQVCGFIWGDSLKHYSQPTLIPNINSWGWATWKEKWSYFKLNTISDLEVKKFSENDIINFNLNNSYNYYKILKKQIKNKTDSWAIQWYYHVFNKGGYSIYPNQSLVLNIGMDGSGTHTIGRQKKAGSLADVFSIEFPEKLTFNEQNFKLFCDDLKKETSASLTEKIWVRFLHYLKKLDDFFAH